MKQTWKKLVSLLLVVMCTLAFSACGKNDESGYKVITNEKISACEEDTLAYIDQLAALTDAELKVFLKHDYNFLRVTAEEWLEQTEVLGELKSYGTCESEVNEEDLQVTVTVDAEFAKTTGTISMVYEYDGLLYQMAPMYTTIAETETFGGNMWSATVNTIMGVGTVFVVLLFLIAVISLLKYVNIIGVKKETPKAAPAVAPKAAPVVVEEDVTDDLELVAVIAAAIAASENTSTDSFVVRSIKKVNRSKWQKA